MDSKDLIKAGRLSDARKQLIEEVKASPADPGKRTLLFQVLAFCGEWDKAARHLDALIAQDPGRETGVQVYKNLVNAEKQRLEVSKHKVRPSFLPSTPPHAERFFSARGKLVENKIDEALEICNAIDAQRPSVSGTLNGRPFDGFQDTDAFLSCFIEAMVYEKYVWLPVESIRELSILPPRTLFDLLWVRALVTAWDGLTINCYLPVLYPESSLHSDDRVKLGRMTDWTPLGGPFSRGFGLHIYQIGEEDVPILEITEIQFNKTSTVGD